MRDSHRSWTLTLALSSLGLSIALLAVPTAGAEVAEPAEPAPACATKNPPRGTDGWTNKGKQCKSPGASCGRLKVCATSFSQNTQTMVTTYKCNCKGANDLTVADLDGLGVDLFVYRIHDDYVVDSAALALGGSDEDRPNLKDLAGLTARLTLFDQEGFAVADVVSSPLQGSSRIGWTVPRLEPGTYRYTVELGRLTDDGEISVRGSAAFELEPGLLK